MIKNYNGYLEECVVLEEWYDTDTGAEGEYSYHLAYYVADDELDGILVVEILRNGEWYETDEYSLPDFNDEEPLPSGGFKLEFDGKMSIIVGQKNYGPMRFTIDSIECVNDVVRTFLKHTDNAMTVNSYEDEEGACMNKMLEFPNE